MHDISIKKGRHFSGLVRFGISQELSKLFLHGEARVQFLVSSSGILVDKMVVEQVFFGFHPSTGTTKVYCSESYSDLFKEIRCVLLEGLGKLKLSQSG
jgi:hypothetical protein